MPFLRRGFRPYSDSPIGRSGIHNPRGGDGYCVYGVLVRCLDGLDAAVVGALPDFQTPIPRNRVKRISVHGESSYGVGVLNPEDFLVTADVDVIFREYEAAEAVVDCRESVDLFELIIR